ncbi:MAG: hypothetical protein LUD69_04725 [Oscillospiraceae bacterium]|nr:hypothetical protein [Oscillospiraceae bacterium]
MDFDINEFNSIVKNSWSGITLDLLTERVADFVTSFSVYATSTSGTMIEASFNQAGIRPDSGDEERVDPEAARVLNNFLEGFNIQQ